MTKDEALRLALEALGRLIHLAEHEGWERLDKEYEAITAIKAALEAKDEPVEFFDWYDNAHWGNEDFKEGCHRAWNAAIKYTAKPTQEAKDEPVAWMFQHEETGRTMCVDAQQLEWGFEKGNPRLKKIAPLYTTPPQRTWVGLTKDELSKLLGTYIGRKLAQAIEAKLKEKNT